MSMRVGLCTCVSGSVASHAVWADTTRPGAVQMDLGYSAVCLLQFSVVPSRVGPAWTAPQSCKAANRSASLLPLPKAAHTHHRLACHCVNASCSKANVEPNTEAAAAGASQPGLPGVSRCPVPAECQPGLVRRQERMSSRADNIPGASCCCTEEQLAA